MSETFETEILTVDKILGGNNYYAIPNYQRPYAWKKDPTEALFDDLWYKFARHEECFINNIFVISTEPKQIVDGQQRLTTLTILLSLLRDKLADKIGIKAKLTALIKEGDMPRLKLRLQDKDFFKKYIQNGDITGLLAFNNESPMLKTEAQRRIVENAKYFNGRLKEIESEQKLEDFAEYILLGVSFCIVTCHDARLGSELFDRLNDAGERLSDADILKAFFLGQIPDDTEQTEYVQKWEQIEETLNKQRGGEFLNLLRYFRVIFTEKYPQQNLAKDFKTDADLRKFKPQELVDSYLIPYAAWLSIINNVSYTNLDNENAARVNHSLRWLGALRRTGNVSYWLPVSLRFLEEYGNNAELTARFFKAVERYISVAYLGSRGGGTATPAAWFYKEIWESLELGGVDAVETKLQHWLGEEGRKAFIHCIDGNIYQSMPDARKKYLMLRLNGLMSDAQYVPSSIKFSIEHVLPQTVDEERKEVYFIDKNGEQVSEDTEGAIKVVPWAEWWAEEDDREAWRHRLANLVMTEDWRNSWASNNDFAMKKQKYFAAADNGGVTPFALTVGILNSQTWTEKDLEKRQDRLMDMFCRAYDIENWQQYREKPLMQE